MRFPVLPTFCLLAVMGGVASSQDWPTYMHDNTRSGVTETRLELPLNQAWAFRPMHPPSPAWPGPAKQDFYHRHYDLRATVAYDRVFHVVGASDCIYFASSSQDKVYALDARSGEVRWAFFTEGPVRFAPTLWAGHIYVGSDDGYVYCLSAADGSLVWKCRIAPDERMIPGNGQMISLWPIRTGLVVDRGIVYCTAGLFPTQGTYLAALDARTGLLKYRRQIDKSPQGYILASPERLYVPTGRTNPAIFLREDGNADGELPSAGGAYALLVDDVLVTGPGRGSKELHADDTQAKDTIATFGGLRMLVRESVAYMQSERRLAAFDRGRYLELSRERKKLQQRRGEVQKSLKKTPRDTPEVQHLRRQLEALDVQIGRLDRGLKACYLWTVECEYPYAMIMAGQTLFLGGEDSVAAVDSRNGSVLWTAKVRGRACGLSIANGALYVSTDAGHIHCFAPHADQRTRTIAEEPCENPYPEDGLTVRYEEAADYIVGQLPSTKGYCLVLDCGRGRLAYELARRTQLRIIAVEPDTEKVSEARRLLDKAGLHGRVTVHHLPSAKLPYTSYFANVVVSDGMLRSEKAPDDWREILRVLRPSGGVVILGASAATADSEGQMRRWGQTVSPDWQVTTKEGLTWGFFRREPLDGSGAWTHMYAEPGNSACSGDRLIRGRLVPQWFGEPGPRAMIDRHHRNIPPLCRDGRLFVPGDCVVFAVDAYNGTVLWQIEVPNSRRLGAFLDGGSMAVDERVLYLAAEDKCHVYAVRNGRRQRPLTMPQVVSGEPHHWGYLAYRDAVVFGSGRRREASYTETSREADEALWYRNMKLVTSDYLFAKNKHNDALLWTYRDGIILDTTIAADQQRIYFVETTSPQAVADTTGRMPVKTLFAGGDPYLVALEQRTGGVVFRRKIDVAHFEEPVYVNVGQGVLLLSGSRLVGEKIRYHYDAFDAETGAELWYASHDTELAVDGAHGEYNRHPTIVGDIVYAWPYAYALRSGKRVGDWKFDRRGHGCGGVSASAQCLFWRGGNPWMYDLGPAGGPARLNAVSRPGCWINIIPAGGLVLIPEASSGCTCGFPLQTSLAYIPESSLR